MKSWWLRPLIRVAVALALPFLVPMFITRLVWSLPGGDPAQRILGSMSVRDPVSLRMEAARLHMDQGWWHFFQHWRDQAFQLELGRSHIKYQGEQIADLLAHGIGPTLLLVCLAMVPGLIGTIGAAFRLVPSRLDGLLQIVGMVPAVVCSIIGIAWLTLQYGEPSAEYLSRLWTRNLLFGAVILGVADGVLSSAVSGSRTLVESERRQRYVSVAILRGESGLSNMLPNILPALVGQFRARALHLLSGAVVVEVILKIEGLGGLLWFGARKIDLWLLLGAATCFALFSAVLMIAQSFVELAVAWHIRRGPDVRLPEARR